MGVMTPTQKKILYNLLYMQAMEHHQIPRGTGKSLAYFANCWHRSALAHANYCLKAIGDSMDGVIV